MRPSLTIMTPPSVPTRTPPRSRPPRSPAPPQLRYRDDVAPVSDGISEPMLFDMSPVSTQRRIEIPDSGSPSLHSTFPAPPPLYSKLKGVAGRSSNIHVAPLFPKTTSHDSRQALGKPLDIISWARETAASTKAPSDAPPVAAPRQLFRYQFPLPVRNAAGGGTASVSRLTANVHRRSVGLGDPEGDVPELVHGVSSSPCMQCVPSDRRETSKTPGGSRRRGSTPDNFTRELEALRQHQHNHHLHSKPSPAAVESSSEEDVLVTPNRTNSRDSVEDVDDGSKSAKDSGSGTGTGSGSGSGSRITFRARTHSPQPVSRGRNRSARPLGRSNSLAGHVVQQMARLELDSPSSSFDDVLEDVRSDAEHRANAFRYDSHVRRRT